MTDAAAVGAWLTALEQRHLADLTRSEVARALRALSSCYVERRGKLAEGGALESAGKRAAFALFYGPLHFRLIQEILRSVPVESEGIADIVDLGCGTGVAGAAWALEARVPRLTGLEKHPWALAESLWTWRQLGVPGRVLRRDITRVRLDAGHGTAIVAAFSMNELSHDARRLMLPRLLDAHARGARVLIVEPIARALVKWWSEWADAFTAAGGRADQWRFPAHLPPLQRSLAHAAGLNPTELTARTLYLPARTM